MVLRRLPRVAVGMLAFASSARAQVPAQPAAPAPPATTAPTSPPPPPPASPPPAAPAPPATPAPAPALSPPAAEPLTIEPSSVPQHELPPLPAAPPPVAVKAHAHRPPHPHAECEWHERARPWFGGLGYGSIAPFFGDLGGLEAMLAGPTGLGASYSAPNTGLLIGGGGGSVLFGHLWLGGKGYGLATGGFENTFGKVSVGGGGGAFEIGYVLSPNPRVLVIPYFGVGGMSESIEVENVSDVDLIDSTRSLAPDEDGQRVIAKPGQTRTFSASFATLEAGIRLQRLLFHRSSGFSAGFEIGFLSSFMNPAWETDGYEVSNAEGASLEGVYIRLNLGGGGFAYR